VPVRSDLLATVAEIERTGIPNDHGLPAIYWLYSDAVIRGGAISDP
jgi:hypothetical protein